MMRRILLLLLSFLQVLFCGVSYGAKGSLPEEPVVPVEPVRSIAGDSNLSESVLYAASVQNTVQGAYTSAKRTAYAVKNTQMQFVQSLRGDALAALKSVDGKTYIADSFDAFCTDENGAHRVQPLDGSARVNVTRLGLYYYECHFRDLQFAGSPFVLDKTYHVWGDRLYQQFTLYALEPTTALRTFGSEIRIPADTVEAVQIRDRSGLHTSPEGVEAASVIYAAFDIRNAGICGFIVPENGGTLQVERQGGDYVVRQTAPYTPADGVNQYDETGGYALNSVSFGCRIYTDETHTFDGIDRAAAIERTPCTVTVTDTNANAVFAGYDPLRGCYTVQMQGMGFTEAWNDPDRHERAALTVQSSDAREIYLRVTENTGCLESAAVLDDTAALSPIPVQVSKNFRGDFGENPRWYTAKDYAYGDCYLPLAVPADAPLSCTVLHLYQNWGKTPLKQLSSIEFHTSYYHLSTGVTESNCIAPYFVYDRDGWLLPDFRGRSGTMWKEQPQFNSVGILNFMQYRQNRNPVRSEYRGCTIGSVGQSYADITSEYVSDCDSYTYSLRHVEFPQTDENRTMISLRVRFDREITFRNFRKDFDLFYFDGRFVTYRKMGYLNADNQPDAVDVRRGTHYYTLGSEAPYFSFYSVTPETQDQIAQYFGSSFGLIVKNCRVTQNGKSADIPLAVRERADKKVTSGVLTLDTCCTTFYPGDEIALDLVLLPWGTGLEEHDENVRAVRQDSALQPARVTAQTGSAVEDAWLGRVRAEENEAQFTLTGGRNNTVVRVDGFTKPGRPTVERQTDGGWEMVALWGENGYDGYSAFYNPDGTYGYAFVLDTDSGDAVYRVTV